MPVSRGLSWNISGSLHIPKDAASNRCTITSASIQSFKITELISFTNWWKITDSYSYQHIFLWVKWNECIQEQQDHNDKTLEGLNLHYRSTLPENSTQINPQFLLYPITKKHMYLYWVRYLWHASCCQNADQLIEKWVITLILGEWVSSALNEKNRYRRCNKHAC